MILRTLSTANICNKKILLRLDLNLPIGVVIDKTRLLLHLETIQLLHKNNNQIIIISHFGRPKNHDPYFSLEFLSHKISNLTGEHVTFIRSLDFDEIRTEIAQTEPNHIILLENTRFFKGETSNDLDLARQWANLADIYVNDAFSVCHREHASVVGIPQFLESYAGLQIEKELKELNKYLINPKKPSIAIVGGSKISSKFDLLNNLSIKFDRLFIGGAMAHSLLIANNIDIGCSLFEPEYIEQSRELMSTHSDKIFLPIDFNCLDASSHIVTRDQNSITAGDKILDVGPKTVSLITDYIDSSASLVWNGPLGFYEDPRFAIGTAKIAKIIAKQTANNNLISVIGGGDIVSAINNVGGLNVNDFSYISPSGGAFLAWLEDKQLPGIGVLSK